MPGDLEGLQNEIRAVKQRWGAEVKLSKAAKEDKGFPFPIGVLRKIPTPQPFNFWDVETLPIKLVIDSLEAASVEVTKDAFPSPLPKKISARVNEEWSKRLAKGANTWELEKMFAWMEDNWATLLSLCPELVDTYEGCNDEGATCRRYTLIVPDAAVQGREEDQAEIDEEEVARREEEFWRARIAEAEAKEAEAEAEAEEKKNLAMAGLGEYRPPQLSKKEMAELNPTRKEAAGHRMRKEASKSSKPPEEVSKAAREKQLAKQKKK